MTKCQNAKLPKWQNARMRVRLVTTIKPCAAKLKNQEGRSWLRLCDITFFLCRKLNYRWQKINMFINLVWPRWVFPQIRGAFRTTRSYETVAHLNFKNLLKFMNFIAGRFERVTKKSSHLKLSEHGRGKNGYESQTLVAGTPRPR